MGNTADLINRTKETVSLLSQAITSTTSGTGISQKGFRGVMHTLNIGDSADTLSGSVYFTVKLEESDALASGYTAVVTADCIGQTLTAGVFETINAPAEDSKITSVQYIGSKEFSRLTITITGTHTNGTPMGIVAYAAGSSHIPI